MIEHPKLIRPILLCLLAIPFFTTGTLAQTSEEEAAPLEITDPAVFAVQESNPRTPAEILQASKLLAELGELELARGYLRKLLKKKLKPKTLAALNRRFGSAHFIKIRRDARLQPEANQLAEAVFAAAQQVARDPQRIAHLIDQLADPSPVVQHTAHIDLLEAGSAALGPLMHRAADNEQPELQHQLADILVSFGTIAVEPLIAVLKTSDPHLRSYTIRVLGQLGDRRAVAYLLRPALSENSNPEVRQTAQSSLRHLLGTYPQPWEAKDILLQRLAELTDQTSGRSAWRDELPVKRWRWNDDDKSLTAIPVDGEIATSEKAADIAAELHRLLPRNNHFRLRFLAAKLAAVKLANGIDQPLEDWAENWGSPVLEAVLEDALAENQIATSVAALEILGKTGDEELVHSPSGNPRLLLRALEHPSARVRFAAAKAVVSLDPQSPYPGSSILIKSLVHFASATGGRLAVVGFPRFEYGQNIAGLLNSLGFDVELAFTGKELFKKATALPDCELIFISDGLSKPSASQIIQGLRRDATTADIPIGLMSRLHNTESVHASAMYDSLVMPIAEPHSVETAQGYVEQMLSLSSRHGLTTEQRLNQAVGAIAWLSTFAADRNRYGFYELCGWESQFEAALFVPDLSHSAADILGRIGSARSQRALVNVASQTIFSLEERKSAAASLATAVQLRGNLLTTGEILQQYERYNSSRLLDKETQDVLGSILDTLESRRQTQP